LLQAYAIEVAIKAQRTAKPKSYGTLYWQFNDAWPGISWSSIDYFGRWKPLQFMAKRLYPDVSIFTINDKVYAVSDKLYPVNALTIIKFFTLGGKLLKKVEKEVNLKINEVQEIYTVSNSDYEGATPNDVVIYTEIVAGKSNIMSSTHFNARFKDLNLPQAEISLEYNVDFNEITIESTGPVVKNLFISHSSTYLRTSNNYFDLVPGHPVKVLILHPDGLAKLKAGLLFRSYREVFTKESGVKVTVK
jgi:beta-mannosidase